MNLRQKYKRAKQKLEEYENVVFNRITIIQTEMTPIKLRTTRRINLRDHIPPYDVIQNGLIRDLTEHIKTYVNFDCVPVDYSDEVICSAELTVIEPKVSQ